jgi:hypothetical protein
MEDITFPFIPQGRHPKCGDFGAQHFKGQADFPFETANQMKWSKKELEAYEARGIYIQDERGRPQYALEEGEKAGYEKKPGDG